MHNKDWKKKTNDKREQNNNGKLFKSREKSVKLDCMTCTFCRGNWSCEPSLKAVCLMLW